MKNKEYNKTKSLTLIVIILSIAVFLTTIGLLKFKDYVCSKEFIYNEAKIYGFTQEQVDKLIDGAKRRSDT